MGPGLPADWKAKAEQDVVAEWNKRASNNGSKGPERSDGPA